MKNFNLKSKKGIILGIVFILVVIFLLVFLNKGLKEKALKILENKEEINFDIANINEYEKYSEEVSTYFEGKQILNFSFIYKKDLKISRGTGEESKWFKVLDSENKNNVTLYFTYEGGRGWKAEDYINNISGSEKDFKVQEVRFLDNSSSTIKYVNFEDKNSEYFIEEIKNEKGEPWLAIVENIKADSTSTKEITRDIVRSFEVK